MRRVRTLAPLLVLGATLASMPPVAGQAARGPDTVRTTAGASTQRPQRGRATVREAAVARRFETLRRDPLRLRAFLREMPKGGDLHNHLSGAIYAESYLRWASEDGLCLSTQTFFLSNPPCDAAAQQVPATQATTTAELYSRAIDAMSMRNWGTRENGHDHFFLTAFRAFTATPLRGGDMLAEATSRAADQRVGYLELMLTPAASARRFAVAPGQPPDYRALRDQLLAAGFRATVVADGTQRLDAIETRQRQLLHCGTPAAMPGCAITVRYIAQVTRTLPPGDVFAQMLAGFELATADPRIVSLNMVAPEDDVVAVRDFDQHMAMLQALHAIYPQVKITLHAGELAPGLVTPEALRGHIAQSVRTAGASRIGHGVDVMHEDHADALLREMAAKNVLVEIAVTSNDVILGVRGAQHPLRTYLRYGVPVALVTDDLGVSRSDYVQEFAKAVEDQGLDYPTLKTMVRNSLTYAFVDTATKTRLLAQLERDFSAFESTH